MRIIDWLIDVLYPRNGEPDRAGVWTKLLVLAALGGLMGIGILASWRC
ncbi:MAG: hypothetical protein HYX68_13845 [Planctomycetes bacterium]|nr:hypothetical protein [Planctomycetota bacterium]